MFDFLFIKSPDWRIYTPMWSRSAKIDGVKLSMDEYRFERRWNGERYEYRAFPLTLEEIYETRAW
ncbi:hypothetical protein RJJ65_32050 [Rhizobium hidalgonense]|uniref:Uncharacterized protein n=1 Tax=Rhizobium hidalgonense TaxID=1538159 RepID=A0AAJ2H3T1_9HYPH|nr:hypothetical protein [Rhizobium hidalgonense]MDR9777191.1 hypothetical protein [Rhizobium hidalgonense]